MLINSGGLEPGDCRITFDEDQENIENTVELDGSTIPDGVRDNPGVAARYPWMVSGNDLVLPNARGLFMRGWDNAAGIDPDAASRSARAGDSQTGDYPGTTQADDFKLHDHVQDGGEGVNNASSGGLDRPDNANENTYYTGGLETRSTNICVSVWMVLG